MADVIRIVIINKSKGSGHNCSIGSVQHAQNVSSGQYNFCSSNGKQTGGYCFHAEAVVLSEAKNSKEIKKIIGETEKTLELLEILYKTGEPPVSPEIQRKASLILSTTKSIKKGDDFAAMETLTKLLTEFGGC